MDYLEGIGLDQVLLNENHLSVQRVLDIFIPIADGLSHAHQKGVVHRDLKPSNIILCLDSRKNTVPRVVDFGIAKMSSPEQALTKTGEIFGSPPYMSPEQCKGSDLDLRSDIYSLGCVMYQSLTGRPPVSGESVLQTLYKQVHEQPPGFREICADFEIPQEIEAIVFKCLKKDRAIRFRSMSELHDALTTYAHKHAGSRSSVALRHKLIIVLVSFLIGTAAVASLLYLRAKMPLGSAKAELPGRSQRTSYSVSDGAPKNTNAASSISSEETSQKWFQIDLIAQKAVNKGDYAEAKKLYQQCELFTHNLGSEYKASTLEGLIDLAALSGTISGFEGDIEKLDEETMGGKKLIAAFKELPSNPASDIVGALISQAIEVGEHLDDAARFEMSRQLLEEALKAARKTKDDSLIAKSLIALADTYRIEGLDQKLSPEEKYRLEAFTVANKYQQRDIFEQAAYGLGRYYNVHGDYSLAPKYLLQALDSAKNVFGKESRQAAKCYFQLACSYDNLQQKALCDSAANSGLQIIRARPLDSTDADGWDLLAQLEQVVHAPANIILCHFENSLAAYEAGPSKKYAMIARRCESLAKAMPQGKKERLPYLRRALVIFQRLKICSLTHEGSLLRLIAWDYHAQHQFVEEKKILEQLVAMVSSWPEGDPERKPNLISANWLAQNEFDEKKIEAAEKHARLFKSWVVQECGPNTALDAEADALLGEIYLSTDRPQEGEKLLRKALNFFSTYKPTKSEAGKCKELKVALTKKLAGLKR